MTSLCRRIIVPLGLLRAPRIGIATRTINSSINRVTPACQVNLLISCKSRHNLTVCRHKSKKAKEDSDDEDDNYNDDSTLSKDSKLVKFSTTSMRTDAILKLALGVARNKIEQAFYESRIRVNGKKIMKKSASVREGDEIDIAKAISAKNPEHIHVSRVEILNVVGQDDSISVTARRFKSLLIENYEQDPFKGNSEQ